MVNKVIINGRAGSGKDTFADYLIDNYGFKKIAFADGIYDIAHKYFDMKEKDRELLQNIGQKMREIDPLIWVNHTLDRATASERVIISDCRQENEYLYALEQGFLPVHIKIDPDVSVKRIEERDGSRPDLSLLTNESEVGADGFTYITVQNNGDFDNLYRQIDKIMALDWSDKIKEIQDKELA